jgi:hypothetical protein
VISYPADDQRSIPENAYGVLDKSILYLLKLWVKEGGVVGDFLFPSNDTIWKDYS